ncbi:unnamed protein product [Rotaria sordida]|uniref:nitric oxide dioxygenase n=1 Tax=Rotaria sordida TaxID=392033 RepID=A0A819FQ51_9BILA|nr:unnamed protein product [Rotaria sordida]
MDTLMPQMKRISSKHRALMVKPEHYPVVGKYLIQAIREHLGSRATPELMEAWQAAYNAVVGVFMKLEKEMYSQLGDNENEKGFLPYTIVEEDHIASGPIVALTLVRQDGGKLFSYRPGQYISIRMEKDGVLHHGHYSMVEPFNGKNYTVAFKKGDNVDQNSIVSNEILSSRKVGSTVLVSPPAGTFGLVEGAKNHLFISGGIATDINQYSINERILMLMDLGNNAEI